MSILNKKKSILIKLSPIILIGCYLLLPTSVKAEEGCCQKVLKKTLKYEAITLSKEQCAELAKDQETYENVLFYTDRTPLLGKCRTPSEITENSTLPKFTLPELAVSIPGADNFTQPDFCKGEEGSMLCIDWIGKYIKNITKYLIGIVGILSTIALMIGGIVWLTSAGSLNSVQQAKKIIANGLIGLLLTFTSVIVLSLLNPKLASFSPLRVPWIEGLALKNVLKGGGSCVNGDCSQVDAAIASNAYNVPGNILKAIFVGGEGCNPNTSSAGACGYPQLMPANRHWCGISGSDAETCQKVKDDIQLAVNCAAKLIAEDYFGRLGGELDMIKIGGYYNTGKPDKCGQQNYCQRVADYYNNKCGEQPHNKDLDLIMR